MGSVAGEGAMPRGMLIEHHINTKRRLSELPQPVLPGGMLTRHLLNRKRNLPKPPRPAGTNASGLESWSKYRPPVKWPKTI